MRRALSLLAVALVTASAIIACDDDEPKPPYSPGDTPPQPISNTSGGGNGEGGAGRDGSTDGGLTEAATSCNDVSLTGIEVQESGVVGDPIPGTGGALAEGNYDLIEAQRFVGTGTPGATGVTYRASMRITGQTIDRFVRQAAIDRITRGTFATNGTALTHAITCPVAQQEQVNYSVNGNNIIFTDVVARTSWTFTKK